MNPKTILKLVGRMGGMKFFPADEDARIGIADEIASMCATEDEAAWLAKRMLQLYPQGWPGVGEMRAAYCASKRPKDGIEVYSSVYVDGVPPEPGGFAERIQISTPALKALPGDVVSAAPSVNEFIADLAKMKNIKTAYPRRPEDLPVNRVTTANRITEEDIEHAVAELHEKRKAEIAAQELAATPSEPERPEVNL